MILFTAARLYTDRDLQGANSQAYMCVMVMIFHVHFLAIMNVKGHVGMSMMYNGSYWWSLIQSCWFNTLNEIKITMSECSNQKFQPGCKTIQLFSKLKLNYFLMRGYLNAKLAPNFSYGYKHWLIIYDYELHQSINCEWVTIDNTTHVPLSVTYLYEIVSGEILQFRVFFRQLNTPSNLLVPTQGSY